MKKLKILAYLLLISLAFACPPPDTTGPKINHPLPQKFKDYTVFKEGTWWVYEDSATGKLDTFVVSKFGEGFLQMDKKYLPNHFFEDNTIFINTNDTVFSSCRLLPYLSENPTEYFVYYNPGSNTFFPIVSYSEIKQSNAEPMVSTVVMPKYMGYDSVLSCVANDTIPYSNLHYFSDENRFDSTWLAPNIGPVKYKFKNKQVLTLKDYHIVQ